MRFTKAHGTGNDFVVVGDLEDTFAPTAGFVRAICDRHFGIGGDGLIRIAPADAGAFFMDYWNADGTTAEMCGNGVRVTAKWLADRGHVTGDEVVIETRDGRKLVRVHRDSDGRVASATVDMGAPILEPSQIPVTVTDPMKVPLEAGGHRFDATCVSMGNPHAVILVDDLDSTPFETLGPAFEADPIFPSRANIEFVQLEGVDHVRVRVYERGVGETLACGTGACAVAVATHLRGLTGRRVAVTLPGGTLDVEWTDETVLMTGPAIEVADGDLDPDTFLGGSTT